MLRDAVLPDPKKTSVSSVPSVLRAMIYSLEDENNDEDQRYASHL